MRAPSVSRRVFGVGLALLLAGCASEPEPVYAPPNYTYLKRLGLNVGTIVIRDDWVPGPDDVGVLSPVRPLDALRRMGEDRLVAVGNTGRAVFRIEDAALRRQGDTVTGSFQVRVDVAGANGAHGYAEARVVRAVPLSPDQDLRPALYALTTQMMNDMNVELEYQLRRTLHDWLEVTSPPSAVVPAPVQQQPLPAPGEQRPPPPASGI